MVQNPESGPKSDPPLSPGRQQPSAKSLHPNMSRVITLSNPTLATPIKSKKWRFFHTFKLAFYGFGMQGR